MGLYIFFYAFSSADWHFIDSVNLIVHEAGHVIFSPFGNFLTILGGSLLQVLLPLIFVFYFWFKEQKFSAGITLCWLSINLFNVSVYARDALRMQLPLITGDTDSHDWNNLLFMLGQLSHAKEISNIIWLLGLFTAITGIYISFKNSNKLNFIDSK